MANLKYKHTAYTSAQWASLNPVIVENEIVIESDTKRTKIGNGISTYNQLEYADANSIGNSLGSIKPTDAAPTPARNGNYTFSIGGNKPAWLTAEAGVTTVKAGDGVAVVYAAPSSYTYTHINVAFGVEQVRSQSTGNVPSSKLLNDELTLAYDKISAADAKGQQGIDEAKNLKDSINNGGTLIDFNATSGQSVLWETGEFNNVNSTLYSSTEIDCADYDNIQFNWIYTGYQYGYAFLDVNGDYISGFRPLSTGTFIAQVPTNAVKFRICWVTSNGQVLTNMIFLKSETDITANNNVIKSILDNSEIFEYDIVYGSSVAAKTGIVTINKLWNYTDIDCSNHNYLSFDMNATSGGQGYTIYDKDGNIISYKTVNPAQTVIVPIRHNYGVIRICWYAANDLNLRSIKNDFSFESLHYILNFRNKAKNLINNEYLVAYTSFKADGSLSSDTKVSINAHVINNLPLPLGKYELTIDRHSLFSKFLVIKNSVGVVSRIIGTNFAGNEYTNSIQFELVSDEKTVSFYTAENMVLISNVFTTENIIESAQIDKTTGVVSVITNTATSVSGHIEVKPLTRYQLFTTNGFDSIPNLGFAYNSSGVKLNNVFFDKSSGTFGSFGSYEFVTPADCASIQFYVKFGADFRDRIILSEMDVAIPGEPKCSIIRFSHMVNTENPFDDEGNTTTAALDREILELDYGVLMLPPNYSATGTPTKLIIFCHGGGGTVTSSSSQVENLGLCRYLVSKGYALMDVSGMPVTYSERLQIDPYRVMGSYFTMNSYQKGYEYVVNNFNISKDGVYLGGASNGGLTSMNLAEHSTIPIRAIGEFNALISMENAWNIASGGPYQSAYQNRANIIRVYGMTDFASQTELEAATIEYDKIKGFDPINFNVIKDLDGKYCKAFITPIKFWHPVNDPVVLITYNRELVSRIKNAGGYAVMREMDAGGHNAESAGSVIGTFRFNELNNNIYPAMEELLMWFNRF